MKPKERLLNSIKGKEIDRTAFSPFLAYFWNSLSDAERKGGQAEYLKSVGADPLLRGTHQLYKTKYKNCEVSTVDKNFEKFVTYTTPVGEIKEEHTYVKSANTWFLTDHAVKTPEDFKVLTYINENMQVTPDYQPFESEYKALGDDGLILPKIGAYQKTGFQSLLEKWVGTEELVYAVYDYPDIVEECLEVMKIPSLRSVEISVDSSAEGFIFWEDSSTTNISPQLFLKYAAPEINSWGDIIHKNGKFLVHHACGNIKDLLLHMKNTSVDVIESVTPPPTGDVEIWEAQEILNGEIALIGGIDPTVFLFSDMNDLEKYVRELLSKVNKEKFILANSDSCPPGVTREKFEMVAKLVKNC